MGVFDPKGSQQRVSMLQYEWGRRAMDPVAPYQQNPDGSTSSHLMAAELDDDGKAWAFPMIVDRGGRLHRFDNPRFAMEYAKRNGQAMQFGSIDEAVQFTQRYKQGTAMDPQAPLGGGW